MEEKSLIEYPSIFPIKVMGKDAPEFLPAMVHIAKQFDPFLTSKPSRNGRLKMGNTWG
jgi:uncharacterized protein